MAVLEDPVPAGPRCCASALGSAPPPRHRQAPSAWDRPELINRQHRGTVPTTGGRRSPTSTGSGRYVALRLRGHQHGAPRCATTGASTCATDGRARTTIRGAQPERQAAREGSWGGRHLAERPLRRVLQLGPGHREAGLVPVRPESRAARGSRTPTSSFGTGARVRRDDCPRSGTARSPTAPPACLRSPTTATRSSPPVLPTWSATTATSSVACTCTTGAATAWSVRSQAGSGRGPTPCRVTAA